MGNKLLRDVGRVARAACGCYQCQGGYPIGESTIAVKPGPDEVRPTSCLAAVMLAELLRREEVD